MKKFEHGGNIYADSSPTGTWLDFSANINPLGISKAVLKGIEDNIAGLVNYPDPQANALKGAIARHYNISEENIVLGNGAAEIFYLASHMLKPRRVLLPVPSFAEYERAVKSSGAKLEYFYIQAKEAFRPNINSLLEAITKLDSGDMLILGNPNNPTGKLTIREDIIRLLDCANANQVMVVVDEAFLDFRMDEKDFSVINLAGKYENLLVIRSMTKFFAIPGLRLGFGVTNKSNRELLDKGKDVWNVNSLAQVAGVIALNDEQYHDKSRSLVATELMFLSEELARIKDLEVVGGSVNFILLRLNGDLSSGELVRRMKAKGILIRDCSNYEGLEGEYVRVAVRMREDNEKLIRALAD